MTNHPSIKRDTRPRPLVIINFAVTADGKVSTSHHTPAQFGSVRDKQRLLEVRALGDAILVGRGTLQTDRMSLDLPDQRLRQSRINVGKPEYPLRVILSASGNISAELPVFQKGTAQIVIYSTERMPAAQRRLLNQHAHVHVSASDELDVFWVLWHLYAHYQVRSIVCEGGPTLVNSLARIDAIDEIYLTITAKLFGGFGALGLTGPPGDFLPLSRRFQLVEIERADNECYLRYRRDF
jgi:2,5-diamino-6-(ribosylamino)-4(3H)-pyrimidinone 5'-phosphate reductase